MINNSGSLILGFESEIYNKKNIQVKTFNYHCITLYMYLWNINFRHKSRLNNILYYTILYLAGMFILDFKKLLIRVKGR